MSIKFSDGTQMDATSYDRLMRLIAEKFKGSVNPTEIVSADGVTLKVGNLAVNPNIKPAKPEKNVLRADYRDWKIQVWRERGEERDVFACNYYRGEDVRYFEVFPDDCGDDENEVFKIAKRCINDDC
jgi:hypothetical protein